MYVWGKKKTEFLVQDEHSHRYQLERCAVELKGGYTILRNKIC